MSQPRNTKHLRYFLFFTFLWTWGFGFAPVLFNLTGTPLGTFLFYFGGGAPSVVGLLFVLFTYSRQDMKDYFRRCFSLRQMGWKFPLLVSAFFALIAVIGVGIGVLMNEPLPEMLFLKAILQNPLMLFPVIGISLVSGPLNEEFGWRGYALDILLQKYGFYGASFILGFIWAIWHLPWYFMPGQSQYLLLQSSLWEAFLFIPATILLSYVVSFVYVHTDRSILAGAVTHMLSNLITSQLLSSYSAGTGTSVRYVYMLFCLLFVIYMLYSKNFKKTLREFYARHGFSSADGQAAAAR